MAEQIILIRHGELPEAYQGRFVGHTDAPLSETGLAQCRKALAGLTCDVLFSSPLLRARQTAACIRQDFLLEPRLAEMDFGQWDNLTFREIEQLAAPAQLSTWFQDTERMSFPGGESFRDFRQRVDSAFAFLAARQENCVGAVTHGGVLMHLLAKLRGMPSTRMFECLPPRGSVVRLRSLNGVWREE
ncbi:MAG: histidine phosphatase family protein [Victivallales bacterium]|nr:histidine phosphatase family protein [Victivallales bacterium]